MGSLYCVRKVGGYIMVRGKVGCIMVCEESWVHYGLRKVGCIMVCEESLRVHCGQWGKLGALWSVRKVCGYIVVSGESWVHYGV